MHTNTAPSAHFYSYRPRLIIIGSSTGGPLALQQILSQLPADYPTPILVVQHMPANFTGTFAVRLNSLCQINVKQAQQGDIIQSGQAYIAPGGQQMLLKNYHQQLSLHITHSSTSDPFHPCIDRTLLSVTTICPEETLVIILTGMGSDGKKGCETLKQYHTKIWSQDKKSCVVYGMPKAIAKADLADKVLNPYQIGQHLLRLT